MNKLSIPTHLPLDPDYLLLLLQLPGIGPGRMRRIVAACPTSRDFFMADAGQLYAADIPLSLAHQVVASRHQLSLRRIHTVIRQQQIDYFTIDDPRYPPLLRATHTPPLLLFSQGRCDWSGPSLAVVGSRQASQYGITATSQLIQPVAAAGVTIVSGLAHGIDQAAAQAALAADGLTVAVLGQGIATLPSRKRALADQIIAAGGMIISELLPEVAGDTSTFPVRNRIIAGSAQTTLVVEAAAKSGALITARWALEENRDVLAVPGSIFSQTSAGTHDLITKGAGLVQSSQDILTALSLDQQLPLQPAVDCPLAILSDGQPHHIDDITAAENQDSATINAQLVELELVGSIEALGGQRYRWIGSRI